MNRSFFALPVECSAWMRRWVGIAAALCSAGVALSSFGEESSVVTASAAPDVAVSEESGEAEGLLGVHANAPTTDDGSWFVLSAEQLPHATKHTDHLAHFGPRVDGYNRYVLAGIDVAQNSAMDGGGYFTGITAEPAESPIGYALNLLGTELLEPPRTTSYCSGASYTAFVEGLNLYVLAQAGDGRYDPQRPANTSPVALDPLRAEAMRMQEPDGGRREDGIKFWGHWNDNGFGSQFALVQYSRMGGEVLPKNARPGDFMNITWDHGGGHSVVFLGWHRDAEGQPHLLYWSSQKSTEGMSDQLVPLSRIRHVKIVRLVDPQRLFSFDPATPVNRRVPGDKIAW